MLNLIRNNLQSFGVKFVVAVVAVVMLTFGLSSFQDQGINTVAEVDGYEVKLEAYQRALDSAQSDYRQKYKENAEQYMESINLKSQIIQQLINNALLLQNAEQNGLAVSNLEVADALYRNPSFQTDDRFDMKRYDRFLQSYRMTRHTYEAQLKESLLGQKYLNFLNSGISFSRSFVEKEYQRFNTRMDFRMIALQPSMFAGQVTASDEDIKQYYDTHTGDFQQKAKFILKYFTLEKSDVTAKVKIREKEIEKYYQKNKDTEFTSKASFHSRHILIPVEGDKGLEEEQKALKKANKIFGLLSAPKGEKKFPALAKRYSADPGSKDKGGDLGWQKVGNLVKEYEAAVDALQVGQISKPFQSQFGYHIIQVLDKKTQNIESLEDARSRIVAQITDKKALRRIKNSAARLLKVTAEETPKTIDELAMAAGKGTTMTEPFDDATNLKGLENSMQLYQLVKNQQLGSKGSFEMSLGDRVMVYQVEKVEDPYIKPLKEVEAQVRVFANMEAERAFAGKKIAEYTANLKTEAQFNKLAAELKVSPEDISIKFSENHPKLSSPDIKSAILKMNAGEIKIFPQRQQYMIVQLIKKTVDTEVKEEMIKDWERYLQQQKSSILLNSLITNMRKGTEIEYNNRIMDALGIQLGS